MRFLLALFSLILVLPTTEAFSQEERQCPQEVEEDSRGKGKDTCVFYSYEQALRHAREHDKLTLVVLLDRSEGFSFELLYEVASSMEDSLLAEFADFVVLARTGVVPLIYPPIQDPMIGEITAFLAAFPDQEFPEQPAIITIAVGDTSAEIMDITLIPQVSEDIK
ncbi:hypothetical protein C6H88_00930 [Chlamydia muridarum str. Nigg]|jgi:hypothetical protein|uniref:TPM domain-containing protein n=2 Tax=Chlamydia muridarum TaxID=83560 RepID=A0A069ZN69_CHLMR|nr:hypothetical protein [Chlamydia muridarum]UFW26289.1 hypothetical protein FTM98_01015 [Chlamydia trachomatis]AAF39051.1 conserved hypothetical protein [Chlamydia muridarum str. Nigg]AHH22570.1 hypothetical protein TAC_00940 [Chlamydia muridarum str. Nigg3 CMUT3-5]AHH23494.1 hypothetical protein Y015_00940 [Chlamydia muridarum str. Nigg CM972]AID37717.1 hypothetical protein BB17_00960 [Chlamydia muridarum str. Nigg 2 MCR]